MTFETQGRKPLDYQQCRYGTSKQMFRGPRRPLDGGHVAFLGGGETYGRYIEQPFPALVESRIGRSCVNFGCHNAGLDVFLNDETVLRAARQSHATVLQVLGAQNMTNRFYTVHPRRNDRFVKASGALRTVYREVDFTEFHFTRHMLSRLREISEDRFALVADELRQAWLSRMRTLCARIGGRIVLLWFAPPEGDDGTALLAGGAHPLFVTRAMIDALRDSVSDVAVVTVSDKARAEGTGRMIFDMQEVAQASEMLNPAAHEEAAAALVPLLA